MRFSLRCGFLFANCTHDDWPKLGKVKFWREWTLLVLLCICILSFITHPLDAYKYPIRKWWCWRKTKMHYANPFMLFNNFVYFIYSFFCLAAFVMLLNELCIFAKCIFFGTLCVHWHLAQIRCEVRALSKRILNMFVCDIPWVLFKIFFLQICST